MMMIFIWFLNTFFDRFSLTKIWIEKKNENENLVNLDIFDAEMKWVKVDVLTLGKRKLQKSLEHICCVLFSPSFAEIYIVFMECVEFHRNTFPNCRNQISEKVLQLQKSFGLLKFNFTQTQKISRRISFPNIYVVLLSKTNSRWDYLAKY